MKLRNILNRTLTESRNLIKRKNRIIKEDIYKNKNIISVDIQPEYEKFFDFDIEEWVDFINESVNENNCKITFLYNGEEMGMVTEEKYYYWLYELGIDEEVLNNATFYDKGYAFFRSCIDNYIDEDNIVMLIKYLLDGNINDSRDLTEEDWELLEKEIGEEVEDLKTILVDRDELFYIPDLVDFLKNYNNIVLIGGSISECLKEVELALLALNKAYSTYNRFVY